MAYTSSHFRTELGTESGGGGKEEEGRRKKEDEVERDASFKVLSLKDRVAPDNYKS